MHIVADHSAQTCISPDALASARMIWTKGHKNRIAGIKQLVSVTKQCFCNQPIKHLTDPASSSVKRPWQAGARQAMSPQGGMCRPSEICIRPDYCFLCCLVCLWTALFGRMPSALCIPCFINVISNLAYAHQTMTASSTCVTTV